MRVTRWLSFATLVVLLVACAKQPADPVEPTAPDETASAAESKPVETAQPAEAAQPAETAQSAETAQPANPPEPPSRGYIGGTRPHVIHYPKKPGLTERMGRIVKVEDVGGPTTTVTISISDPGSLEKSWNACVLDSAGASCLPDSELVIIRIGKTTVLATSRLSAAQLNLTPRVRLTAPQAPSK